MKKLTHILVALVVTFAAVLSLSACGKNPVESATVSGLALSVAKGDTLDTKKVVVTAKYKKGDTKTFSGDDLSFGEFSTAEMGTATLTITIDPENYSFDVSIKVVASEADVNAISQLESELVKEYNANRLSTGEYETFAHNDITLRAGTMNPFHFRLKTAGIAADGETLIENIANVRTIVKVELKDKVTGNYSELTGTELETYVKVETINAVLDFTDDAVGKTFRITVTAANPDEGYETANYSFSAVLDVIEGFNVYDTVDLSVYDNYHVSGNTYRHDKDFYRNGWDSFHQQVRDRYGIQDLSTIQTLILQDDIEIDRWNVRDDAFWHTTDANYAQYQQLTDQTLLDTPHNVDNQGIFQRMIAPGEQFTMIGNYFAIDIQKLPKMVVYNENDYVNFSGDQAMTGYFSLFKTDPTEYFQLHTAEHDTYIKYETMSFIGNGQMSADVRNSGSVLLMKHDAVDFYGYNTIANNFYTTYYFAVGNPNNDYDGHYEVRDCKAYNSYTSAIYIWGGEETNLINSEFRNSGGPAILADCLIDDTNSNTDNADRYMASVHPDKVHGTMHYAGNLSPIVNVINTTLEAKASGQEPWYTEYDAGSAVGLMAMLGECLTGGRPFDYTDSPYTPTGKTVIADLMGNGTVPRINIEAVIFGPGIITNDKPLSGSINVYNSEAEYLAGITANHGLNLDNYIAEAIAGRLDDEGKPAGAPVFECTETGAFRTAPFNGQDFIYDGVMFNNDIATMVLTGLYAGIYPKLQGFASIPSMQGFLAQLPTIEQFNALNNENRLVVINNILDTLTMVPTQMPEMSTMIDEVIDEIYSNVSLFAPVSNWAELAAMPDVATRIVAKVTSFKASLASLVATCSAGWSGNHVNLYLPGNFGYMGILMGLYPTAA